MTETTRLLTVSIRRKKPNKIHPKATYMATVVWCQHFCFKNRRIYKYSKFFCVQDRPSDLLRCFTIT